MIKPRQPIIISLMLTQMLVSSKIVAQSTIRLSATDYINAYAPAAIKDMQLTGVPASITLAQGMFESDYGNSPLAQQANNHFGIKCHKEWNGKTYIQDDDEKNECFRLYENVQQSYDDHSNFLKTRPRYSFLFSLEQGDYIGWAKGLKQAGYATNPDYANRLIKLIEENNLSQYDKPVLNLQNAPFAHQTDTIIKTSVTVFPLLIPKISYCDDLPYAIAAKGDTWYKLAKENDITLANIFKYNDAGTSTILRQGMLVYLKPKHNCSHIETHLVASGETLWYISQLYGVKLKKLMRYNRIEDAAFLNVGEVIKLR
ncbi:MAG: glucosaminidase domain-containing protein [Bacteroidia bacterium]|nr:glucosaminidase domain-containing protein [Bacteroidia bacterium]